MKKLKINRETLKQLKIRTEVRAGYSLESNHTENCTNPCTQPPTKPTTGCVYTG